MIDYLIQQLHNPDAAIRRRAIIKLGRSKDPVVLKALGAVVRSDSDPELRELARKAGLYIRQQMRQQTRQSERPATPPPPEPLPPPVSPFTVPISEADTPLPGPAPKRPHGIDDLPSETFAFDETADEASSTDIPIDTELPDLPEIFETFSGGAYEVISGEQIVEDDKIIPIPDEMIPTPEDAAEIEAEAQAKAELLQNRRRVITKDDEQRAKHYLDTALTLNMEGDNARAMKNLTRALGLDPRLTKDTYFNSVATAVTHLDGDEAVQMIVDRGERQRFTQDATLNQKNRRIERHMDEAQQSTWTDFWFEWIIYALIVIIGPILATLVMSESASNLIKTFAQPNGELPAELQQMQTMIAGLTETSLLPIGIISGISGVLSLLLQTVIIHLIAVGLLHGFGTWVHLVHVLLGFYNKWFPILFFILYITIAAYFISLGSPIILCLVIVLVILSLYISSKTSGKIGEAYDFGGAMGCASLVLSSFVIILINAGLGFILANLFNVSLSLPVGFPGTP